MKRNTDRHQIILLAANIIVITTLGSLIATSVGIAVLRGMGLM